MPIINPLALPPFPTWPPPSGGAPITQVEQSPKLGIPYGLPQGANISTANPSPHPGAFLSMKVPIYAGQTQATTMPAWPHNKVNTLPDKANPGFSSGALK